MLSARYIQSLTTAHQSLAPGRGRATVISGRIIARSGSPGSASLQRFSKASFGQSLRSLPAHPTTLLAPMPTPATPALLLSLEQARNAPTLGALSFSPDFPKSCRGGKHNFTSVLLSSWLRPTLLPVIKDRLSRDSKQKFTNTYISYYMGNTQGKRVIPKVV